MDQSDGSAGVSGRDGEGSVEYENVPLYEEIPEYMNLPFLSARLGWPLTHSLDPSTHRHSDSDVYEVQDPYESHCDYKRPHSIDYERYSMCVTVFVCARVCGVCVRLCV